MIVSLVRGGAEARDEAGVFARDVRRSNVLLTRVRRRMYVVGTNTWRAVCDSDFWRAFVDEFGGLAPAELAAEMAVDDAAALEEIEHATGPVVSSYSLNESALDRDDFYYERVHGGLMAHQR